MTRLTRLLSALLLATAMFLVPLTSAAGDGTDGSTGGSGSSGSGDGTGTGGTGSGGGTGSEPPTTPVGVSTPRVMVEGFEVKPERVFAGQNFTLAFSLRNTSAKTRVQNLKVTVSSADSAFLPTGGSSSIFIARIGAERISGQTMAFRALPGLEAKPYPVTIAIDYEDANATAYQSTETLAIEVSQELRADSSTPVVTPMQLTLGQQGSLTFNVINQGKAKLYNARASIADGQALGAVDAFVGNIEPGASGAVDLTVTAVEPATGPVPVVITYEDVTGQSFTITKQVDVPILEEMPIDPNVPEYPEPMPEPAGFPWIPVVASAAAVAALVTVLLLVRASRRKKAAREDAASLAALEGESLIDDDWQ